MARHSTANKKAERQDTQGGDEQTPENPTIQGGAAGVLVGGQPETASQVRVASDDPARQATAQRYMVVDGPRDLSGAVKYYSQGYMARLPAGKIVTGATHNLKEMRDQGIQLRMIPDEVDESAPPLEEQTGA